MRQLERMAVNGVRAHSCAVVASVETRGNIFSLGQLLVARLAMVSMIITIL